MGDLPDSIHVESLHTPEMIRAELSAMLERRPAITPRRLARLWLANSPFVLGGPVTEQALSAARGILGRELPAATIEEAVATSLRALETIVPESGTSRKLTRDDGDSIGPEWLADLYAAVSRAAPGIPWREFLDMPLAAATHLAAAAHRANGGGTERPVDWEGVLAGLEGQVAQ